MRIYPLVALTAAVAGHVLPELVERRADSGVFYTTVVQTAYTTEVEHTTATSVLVQTAYVITTGLPCENDGHGPQAGSGGSDNQQPHAGSGQGGIHSPQSSGIASGTPLGSPTTLAGVPTSTKASLASAPSNPTYLASPLSSQVSQPSPATAAVTLSSGNRVSAVPVVTTTTTECEDETTSGFGISASTLQPLASGSGVSVSTLQSVASAPATTLQPALPANHSGSDLSHLVPTIQNALYFTETGAADTTISQLFALMKINNTYPSVVLDHSSFITNVSCVGNGLRVKFSTPEALAYASSMWNGTFIVVTSTVGCAGATMGEHTYWIVSSATFPSGANYAALTSQEIAIEDALKDVDLVWGTQPAGNSTAVASSPTASTVSASSPTGSSCGAPPAPTIRGLAAAACGPNFDQVLDDKIGYFNFSDEDAFSEFAPGLNTSATAKQRRDAKNPLRRRIDWGLPVPQFFKDVGNAIVSLPAKAVNTAVDLGKTLQTAVVDGAQALGQIVSDQVDKFTNTAIDKSLDINIGPPQDKLVDSTYWGQAFPIYQGQPANKAGTASGNVALYCVDCGISGQATISGQLGFSIGSSDINKGSLALDGHIAATLNLGLVAEVAYQNTWRKTVAEAGLPGFRIPKVITVGPVISLDAEATINLDAAGRIYLNSNASLPAFHADFSLVDGSFHQSGWQPQFQATVTAQGQIAATLKLGVPLSVGVGLVVPLISYEKKLALTNEPYIAGKAEYVSPTISGSTGTGNGGNTGGSNTGDNSAASGAGNTGDNAAANSGAGSTSNTGASGGGSSTGDNAAVSSGASSTGDNAGGSSGASSSGDNAGASGGSSVARLKGRDDTPSTGTGACAANSVSYQMYVGDDVSLDLFGKIVPLFNYQSAPLFSGCVSLGASQKRDSLRRRLSSSTPTANGTTTDFGADDDLDPDEVSDLAISEAQAAAAADSDDSAADDTADDDGTAYTTIADSTGTWHLSTDPDTGTLALQSIGDADDGGLVFETFGNGAVGADAADRLLHYYPAEMAALGVSRVLVSGADRVPLTADFVTLVPVNTDGSNGTPSVLVAVDSVGRSFVTVACNLDGTGNKIFLANDTVAGPAALLQSDLWYTVAGGVTSGCAPVAFLSPAAGLSESE